LPFLLHLPRDDCHFDYKQKFLKKMLSDRQKYRRKLGISFIFIFSDRQIWLNLHFFYIFLCMIATLTTNKNSKKTHWQLARDIFPFIFYYHQIWLNCLLDDHHFSYIKKMEFIIIIIIKYILSKKRK
jgi:hypothetical protein